MILLLAITSGHMLVKYPRVTLAHILVLVTMAV